MDVVREPGDGEEGAANQGGVDIAQPLGPPTLPNIPGMPGIVPGALPAGPPPPSHNWGAGNKMVEGEEQQGEGEQEMEQELHQMPGLIAIILFFLFYRKK